MCDSLRGLAGNQKQSLCLPSVMNYLSSEETTAAQITINTVLLVRQFKSNICTTGQHWIIQDITY